LPNVGPYIYDVSISGFTRSSIYIYDISSLRVNEIMTLFLSSTGRCYKTFGLSEMTRCLYSQRHVGNTSNSETSIRQDLEGRSWK